ncbi:MAG: DUF1684 domain-containing protein [Proteobacteria bacterium]|nr:DUF1684 domain-containing protein [Pseudomonadota bacterium]
MSRLESATTEDHLRRRKECAASAWLTALGSAFLLGPALLSGGGGLLQAAAANPVAVDPAAETREVEAWRARRAASLTSENGWLTLVGLFWFKPGANSFGSAAGNALRLENPALASHAGTFTVSGREVRFHALSASGITHDGQPVDTLLLASDATGTPTVLASGSLRFYVIERAGHLGVRVRDLDNPHRRQFRGLDYFPVSTEWAVQARFEPYQPPRSIRIVNILGMEEDMPSPGALVFMRDGKEWRLDAVQEEPGAQELFVMFQDATSGHDTYGGGRFMYIPLPRDGVAQLDFNKAFNPPCALNDFATCPLPPLQNRLALRIDAGEKTYMQLRLSR